MKNLTLTSGAVLAGSLVLYLGCGDDKPAAVTVAADAGAPDAPAAAVDASAEARPADASVSATVDAAAALDASVDRASGVDAVAVDRPPAVDVLPLDALPRPDLVAPDVSSTEAGAAVTTSFFITSTGSGASGGNLGGLDGADKKCKDLATAVGLGAKTWRAYLSTDAANGQPAVNARDRIGKGPWYNRMGIMIAADLTELHGPAVRLNLETALDEMGKRVPGRGTPADQGGNQHDILTGSKLDGTAAGASCLNWTSSAGPNDGGAETPTAQVGHFDRDGGGVFPQSWNAAHATPGCDEASIKRVGGAGRFYCFAID